MSVTVRLSDCPYASSACTPVILHDSPYTRFKPIPSSHEWEQSRKVKKFHRAFTNSDLLLSVLHASSIYLRDSRCLPPPKSGEDAHITHGMCDFGGTTLNKPSLGFSYVLPRLWDPGGVRSPPNVPRDRSTVFCGS